MDFLSELPGEREYYRTSTETNDYIPTTYSGNDDGSGSGYSPENGGSGAGPLEPPPQAPPDAFTYYFVRVNIDGEENNETDRQWQEFLRSNGVDPNLINGNSGNFGVVNLMPSDDINEHLTQNTSAIKLTEDDLYILSERMAAENKSASTASAVVDETVLESTEIPDGSLSVDELNSTLYELINETLLRIPVEESVEVVAGSGSGADPIEDISLVSQRERDAQRGGDTEQNSASEMETSEENSSINLSTENVGPTKVNKRVHEKNKTIDAIIKRYKMMHGWSFSEV